MASAPAATSRRSDSGAMDNNQKDSRHAGRSRTPLRRNPKHQRPPEPKVPPKSKPSESSNPPCLASKSAPSAPPPGVTSTGSQDRATDGVFAGERYGCWTRDPKDLGNRPRCLHLFSGPQRKGDLADFLSRAGWVVCSCDTKQPVSTNLLDSVVRTAILEDINNQMWDAIYLGTPCETYSALREIQPGPKPLRSPNELSGITQGLSPSEKKQLQEGNEHTEFSADVMKTAHGMYTPFTVENPEPLHPVSIFNMKSFKEVARLRSVREVDFDQCRFDCESKKPTRFMTYRISYSSMSGLRCNHEPKEFRDAEGKTYKAAHEKIAQRRRAGPDGRSEYASKALGNYPPALCKVIATAISNVNMERAMKARELQEQPLP